MEQRLIDANKIKYRTIGAGGWNQPENVVSDYEIEKMPTVDAVEVVHGEWRKVYTCHGEQAWGYECNQCKADNPRATYYCPNCGAKMDGDGNG